MDELIRWWGKAKGTVQKNSTPNDEAAAILVVASVIQDLVTAIKEGIENDRKPKSDSDLKTF